MSGQAGNVSSVITRVYLAEVAFASTGILYFIRRNKFNKDEE